MQFNDIVVGVLEGYEAMLQDARTTVPMLDGKREVYTFTLGVDVDGVHVNNTYRLSRIVSPDAMRHLWDEPVKNKIITYEGNSYANALYALTLDLVTTPSVDEAIQQLQKIAQIRGTWRVIERYSSRTIGVEVDVDAYSGVHNAIDDDINNF